MVKDRIRKVKLQGKYYRQESHCNGGRDLPWLNVSGLWLEQAGFKAGDAVGDHRGAKCPHDKKPFSLWK